MFSFNAGNGTATISTPSTPVMPPMTPSVMPVITPSAKLPLQTLPNKSKPVTQQPPLKTTQPPQKMPQKVVTQSKVVVTSPPPQKLVTSSKLMTSQKPASTSKVTPTATPTTKSMKPSINGSSPLPVTLTKSNSDKTDLIVMEKMTNCSYATVKDSNGGKK